MGKILFKLTAVHPGIPGSYTNSDFLGLLLYLRSGNMACQDCLSM
ncbi:hypothetical protein TREAZ_2446 [Leadbettera azotonutricia ZAS-9]|uniref:Uncharacterized protein n=1 Tax=Leadbettera azotonutricia (strain ATCC BAA-888 / DSM 13862 / ZAS-9) TaxID=545695 RepID=F5YFS2_LEAAZ|nr:hypothetical protein TREAZ_2446 [Leadbettera azotonutricia ZAS-9]